MCTCRQACMNAFHYTEEHKSLSLISCVQETKVLSETDNSLRNFSLYMEPDRLLAHSQEHPAGIFHKPHQNLFMQYTS